MIGNINLTREQQKAIKEMLDWYNSSQQVFYLAGYAGTGKTTLVSYFTDHIKNHNYYIGAYTGKAALVLQKKGHSKACTIHSMIYKPIYNEKDELDGFDLKSKEEVKGSLFILDECSMIDDEIYNDLLSFGKKVLFLGDTAQLPPINNKSAFAKLKPNYELKEVHRQAENNPIIKLSMKVRNGEQLDYCESPLVNINRFNWQDIYENKGQILCGTHKRRVDIINSIRNLKGYETCIPQSNEPLICLKNNKDEGLVNGMICEMKDFIEMNPSGLKCRLSFEDDIQKTIEMNDIFLKATYKGITKVVPNIKEWKYKNQFDFAYAITTHKAQGSQWKHVTVVDESMVFRADRYKWLYTAITRAEESITILKI